MTIAVVNRLATAASYSVPSAVAQNDLNPMSKQDDYRKNAEVKVARQRNMAVNKGHLLALAERWLRPADQLDYMIRRWVIPVSFEANRSIVTNPVFPVVRTRLAGK